MFGNKRKLKLSLIDDYIKIITIKNFYNNPLEQYYNVEILKKINKLKELLNNLSTIYLQIFEKIRLKDESFMLLNHELSLNNKLFESITYENFSQTVDKTDNDLHSITNNLSYKLKKLKIDKLILLN